MTEWKPEAGKMAAVMVERVSDFGDGMWCIRRGQKVVGFGLLHESALHPLPPSASPEMLAVVEAATVWRKQVRDEPISFDSVSKRLAMERAIDAYNVSIAPPDPNVELLAAWDEYSANSAGQTEYLRLSAAFAAVKAMGAK